jgi:predicted MFS family arabinose efflux permease
VAAILPVLVGVWQKQAGIRVDQAGFVAATELFAQVVGTGFFLWASPRWTLRVIAVASLFYFSWCASFPFQFTVISQSDSSGRASAVLPAADGLGLAGGAAIASVVAPMFGLESTGWICAAASVIGITLYIGSATLAVSRSPTSV